jgi:hypothetical protein
VSPIQIVGVLIAVAGIVWIFIHPTAKGEGEAGYAGITVKALTQGGLILVVGAALIFLGRDSGDDDLTLSEWATSANQVCDRGYEQIRNLPLSADPTSQFQALPQTTQISTDINQEIQALGRPSGAEAKVDRLLALASQGNVEARRAFGAWSSGDMQTAQAALAEAQSLSAQVQRLDGELGANVCALGP